MIKLEKTQVSGWEATIRGMRNAMNSWDKSDSAFRDTGSYDMHDINWNQWPDGGFSYGDKYNDEVYFGENDVKLMKQLASAGSDHAKFRRLINVTVDITAPLYWWKEMDTYRIGVAENPSDIEYLSCSTMHKITAKEFTIDDFSHEHLFVSDDVKDRVKAGVPFSDIPEIAGFLVTDGVSTWYAAKGLLEHTIHCLNQYREMYLKTKDKRYWWQLIQLLPSSYNQKRTWKGNYEVLSNIRRARKGHRLDEWKSFIDWIEELPLAKEVII